jgi:serine/threonine protein phosphatase PrpC
MSSLHSSVVSERGMSATNNDALCNERIGRFQVFAVASGRTGRPSGKQAGEIAVAALRESVKDSPGDPAGALERALDRADERIGALGVKDREHSGTGTELSACLVDENTDCTILDTGNGGVYYISPRGIVLPREIPFTGRKAVPVKRKMISHTLGEPRVLRGTEISQVNLMDSFIVLSSAGFHDYVGRDTIVTIVRRNGENVDTSCEELKNAALQAGSESTVTLIILHGHST